MLTLERCQSASAERSALWHVTPEQQWSILEWAGAMCGEAGEVANVCKKIRRIEQGIVPYKDREVTMDQLVVKLADELADTFEYLLLVANAANIDLAEAHRIKFNEVSRKAGFPVKL